MHWTPMADVEVPFLIATKCGDRRCRGSKTSHLDDVLQLQPFDGSGKSRVSFLHWLISRHTIAFEQIKPVFLRNRLFCFGRVLISVKLRRALFSLLLRLL